MAEQRAALVFKFAMFTESAWGDACLTWADVDVGNVLFTFQWMITKNKRTQTCRLTSCPFESSGKPPRTKLSRVFPSRQAALSIVLTDLGPDSQESGPGLSVPRFAAYLRQQRSRCWFQPVSGAKALGPQDERHDAAVHAHSRFTTSRRRTRH
jgi:hypothetical protein